MKKFYTLTVIVLAVFLFINTTSAQTYSGGTYTAVRSGNWHTPSGINVWDVNGEPSSTCSNCLIIINSGVTVTLNTDIFLKGTSKVVIGTDGSNTAEILIPASNTTAPTPSNAPLPISGKNRIDMEYSSPGNVTIQLLYPNSVLDASNTDAYDGVYLYVFVGSPNNSAWSEIKRMGLGTTQFPEPSSSIITGSRILTSDGTLPITLVGFNAVLSNGSINITWTTEQEINSDHFAVQRSDDGTHWQNITTIEAKGFSFLPVNYSYTDASPSAGVNYYRLQSFDQSGKFVYSDIKVVRGSVTSGIKVFPNPARNYVNITLGNDITGNQIIRLTDLSGKSLQQKQVSNAAGTTVSLPVGNYAQGIYLLQVKSANGTQQTYKIFISQN